MSPPQGRALLWPVLSILCLQANVARAHLGSVCTATHAQRPRNVTFLYGTYHTAPSAGSSVPGTAFIRTPSGNEFSFPYDNFCSTQNSGLLFSDSVEEFRAIMLSESCTCRNVLGCGGYNSSTGRCTSTEGDCSTIDPSLTQIDCFTQDANVPRESQTADGWTQAAADSDSFACGYPTDPLNAIYSAQVHNIYSGIFEVWSTGTDDNLATGGYPPPCDVTADTHAFVPVTVADGGAECLSPPGTDNFASECDPTTNGTRIISGYVCSSVCPDGLVNTRAFTCNNGIWSPEAQCLNASAGANCPANAAVNIAANISGVTGAGCGQITPTGSSCQVICKKNTWGGGNITCTDNKTWALTDPANFKGCSTNGDLIDFLPPPPKNVITKSSCPFNKLVVDFEMPSITVLTQWFQFDPVSANVTCYDYTSALPPPSGHVCFKATKNAAGTVRVRGCNNAGCGPWSNASMPAVNYDLLDEDADGICDTVDSCLGDALNDADADDICDAADSCLGDALNDDADADDICDTADSCLGDALNDADADGICDTADSCLSDALNDDDSDGVCNAVAAAQTGDLTEDELMWLGVGIALLIIAIIAAILLWCCCCGAWKKNRKKDTEVRPNEQMKNTKEPVADEGVPAAAGDEGGVDYKKKERKHSKKGSGVAEPSKPNVESV